MIIGDGLISNSFKNFNHDDYIIFGSGVSNSKETNENEFEKEKILLLYHINNIKNKKLIYFNSIMTFTNINTPYFNHKRDMVKLIKDKVINYKIYNIPQIFGSNGNNKNLINYFITCLKNKEKISIQKNTYRSIIDIDDIYNIVIRTLDLEYKEFNISYIELLTVKQILETISNIYNISPIYVEIDDGVSINMNNDDIINSIIFELNINKNNYTEKTIKKYVK